MNKKKRGLKNYWDSTSIYILPLPSLSWMYELYKAWKWKPYFSLSALYPTVSCLWWIHLGLYQLKLDSQLWAITVRPVGPTVYSLSCSHPHCATPLQFIAWLGKYSKVKVRWVKLCSHFLNLIFASLFVCDSIIVKTANYLTRWILGTFPGAV